MGKLRDAEDRFGDYLCVDCTNWSLVIAKLLSKNSPDLASKFQVLDTDEDMDMGTVKLLQHLSPFLRSCRDEHEHDGARSALLSLEKVLLGLETKQKFVC